MKTKWINGIEYAVVLKCPWCGAFTTEYKKKLGDDAEPCEECGGPYPQCNNWLLAPVNALGLRSGSAEAPKKAAEKPVAAPTEAPAEKKKPAVLKKKEPKAEKEPKTEKAPKVEKEPKAEKAPKTKKAPKAVKEKSAKVAKGSYASKVKVSGKGPLANAIRFGAEKLDSKVAAGTMNTATADGFFDKLMSYAPKIGTPEEEATLVPVGQLIGGINRSVGKK